MQQFDFCFFDLKVMELLLEAERVQFRYYAGPDMISLPLSGYRLRQLQSLVALEAASVASENYSGSLFK